MSTEDSIKIHIIYLRIHKIILLTQRCSSSNKPGIVSVRGHVRGVPCLCRVSARGIQTQTHDKGGRDVRVCMCVCVSLSGLKTKGKEH